MNVKLSGGQTLAAIGAIITVGVTAVVVSEALHLDTAPILGLISPTLVVLVGVFHLDSSNAARVEQVRQAQQVIKGQVDKIEKQTNGALNTSLAIIQANSMDPKLVNPDTNIPLHPNPTYTEQEGQANGS